MRPREREQRIDDIVRFYSRFSDEERKQERTAFGYYQATNMELLREFFQFLWKKGIVESTDHLVVAGGGDGRIAALAALYCAYVYSIEGDPHIHQKAEERIGELFDQRVFTSHRLISLVRSDFLWKETYTRTQIPLKSIDHVFNSGDNDKNLARFMRAEMPQQTHLLLMRSTGERVNNTLTYSDTYRTVSGQCVGKVYRNVAP